MTYDIHFDVPPGGDHDQGMWIVVPIPHDPLRDKGRWKREEQAEAECNKRNKALGWTGEWIGESK